jgi:glycosyltransferase involved in cell wall biosynthesis
VDLQRDGFVRCHAVTAQTVAICVPSFNAGPHLRECLSSILSQSYVDWELVLVDDGSTDSSWDVAVEMLRSEPRARALRNDQGLGAAANWAKVIELTSAPLVKLVCSDDVLEPDAIEKLVGALERHPSAAMSAGRRRVIDGDGTVLMKSHGLARWDGVVPSSEVWRRVVRSGGNVIGEPSAVLFRRAAFDACRGFPAEWRYLLDLAGYAEILRRGDLVVVPGVVASFRVWPGSWSAALHRQQARETRLLSYEVRRDGCFGVTRADAVIGVITSQLRQWGRGLLSVPIGRRWVDRLQRFRLRVRTR